MITIDHFPFAITVTHNYRANKFSSQQKITQNVDNFIFLLREKILNKKNAERVARQKICRHRKPWLLAKSLTLSALTKIVFGHCGYFLAAKPAVPISHPFFLKHCLTQHLQRCWTDKRNHGCDDDHDINLQDR